MEVPPKNNKVPHWIIVGTVPAILASILLGIILQILNALAPPVFSILEDIRTWVVHLNWGLIGLFSLGVIVGAVIVTVVVLLLVLQ